jgi:hypothetical protein
VDTQHSCQLGNRRLSTHVLARTPTLTIHQRGAPLSLGRTHTAHQLAYAVDASGCCTSPAALLARNASIVCAASSCVTLPPTPPPLSPTSAANVTRGAAEALASAAACSSGLRLLGRSKMDLCVRVCVCVGGGACG